MREVPDVQFMEHELAWWRWALIIVSFPFIIIIALIMSEFTGFFKSI